MLQKGKKPRDVFHYHFVAWPDMGCPTSPDQLLNFLSYVKNAQNPDGPPILVHCRQVYNSLSLFGSLATTIPFFNCPTSSPASSVITVPLLFHLLPLPTETSVPMTVSFLYLQYHCDYYCHVRSVNIYSVHELSQYT